MNLHSKKRLTEIGKSKSNFKEGGGAGIVFEFEKADLSHDYGFDKRGVIRYTVENLPIASYMNTKIVEDAGYIDIKYSSKSKDIDVIEMYGNYVASKGYSRTSVDDFYDISDSFGVAMNPYGTEATEITFYPSDEFKAKYESIDDMDDEDDFSESVAKKSLIKKLTLKSYLEKKLTINSKEAQLIESVIKEYIRKKNIKRA